MDLAERGKVKVVNGKYKPEGKFHYIYSNTPMFDESGKLVGVTNPRDMTYIHTYGGEAIFFESLSKGKLIASKCVNDKCFSKGSVHMPFRIHCPDCLVKCEPIDITKLANDGAVVHSFMITERTGAFNTLPKPIKFVNIEFEGVCTILMGSLAVGEPKIGAKVVPIFNTKAPTFTILDMLWVIQGTPVDQLPENYTFS